MVAAGTSVLATVGVSGGETIQSFSVGWAPGQTTTEGTGVLLFAYTTPGLYAVFANATTPRGVVHTGTGQLVPLKVNPSATSVETGHFPGMSLTLTNATGGPYPWIGRRVRHRDGDVHQSSGECSLFHGRTDADHALGLDPVRFDVSVEFRQREVHLRERGVLPDHPRRTGHWPGRDALSELYLGGLCGCHRRRLGLYGLQRSAPIEPTPEHLDLLRCGGGRCPDPGPGRGLLLGWLRGRPIDRRDAHLLQRH